MSDNDPQNEGCYKSEFKQNFAKGLVEVTIPSKGVTKMVTP